ncbi:MAG: SpoIIE family protein phosphatase, partial [bacterium]|nr:SpoIIE family protein phosphatase [bacterium]
FYAVLDKRNMNLTCANAGHPPLLLSKAGGEIEWVHPEGIAVGLSRNGNKPVCRGEKEVALSHGDLVFFYTDGITDALDFEGRYFGRERLGNITKLLPTRGGEPFLTCLQRELAAFSQDQSQSDDMTGVVLYRK